MGCRKIYITIVSLLLLAASVAAEFRPELLEWQSITSFRNVRAMLLVNDTAYLAASGGLLKISDPALPPVQWTNTDGLGTNDLTDIVQAGDGVVWLAGNGRLIRLDQSLLGYVFQDENNEPIRLVALADDGDRMWVGTDTGLVLFDKLFDGGQIDALFENFGNLNPATTVNDIAVVADSIWLATNDGIAVGSTTEPRLLYSPSSWRTYQSTGYPELAADSVARVVHYQGRMYFGTADGLYFLGRNAADDADSLVRIDIGANAQVYDLKVENDTLFYYRHLDLGFVANDSATPIVVPGATASWTTGLNTGGYRWLVRDDFGGILETSSGAAVEYEYTGMPGENVSDLAVTADNILTVGLTEKEAASRIDAQWVVHPIFRNSTNVLVDSTGRRWLGSFGAGLFELFIDSMFVYNKDNSPLIGNNDDPSFFFTVIEGIATDGRYLYAAAYRAANGYPIGIADLNRLPDRDAWDSLGIADGLVNDRPVSVDVYGVELAVGMEAIGLYLCGVGADPSNRTGQICRLFDEQNSLLRSNNVRLVRYAPDGTLWAATAFGLSRFDRGIDRFEDIDHPAQLGPDIAAMEFDSRGNLWLGGRGGLARRDATTGDFVVFTSRDGLVDNRVKAIHYDRYTGEVYVGTQAGVSKLTSTIGRPPQESIERIAPFPNPYVIRNGDERLSFNFSRDATVTIFSTAGERVRVTTINGGWDGRNEAGSPVASGIYLFVVQDGNGALGRGKILLVRD